MKVKVLLLVDDDPEDLHMLEIQLKKIDESIQLFKAHDGEEALETLHSMLLQPDLIFLDINMPRMDGKHFLKEIKKISAFKHIPIVIYSTSWDQKDIDETSRLGASYYLTKPDNPSQLRDSLTNILLFPLVKKI